MSAGTTARGAFRFPYDFESISDEIRTKLQNIGMGHDFERVIDQFISLMADRDRALEDYTTAGYSTPFFVTVAADGSGNYTTIRDAIQAQPAGMAGQSSGYNVIIYVKPQSGGYLESALGTVTFPTGTVGVTLWAGPAGEDLGAAGGNNNNSYLAWQSGGWIKAGGLNFSIKGFRVIGPSSTVSVISNSSTAYGGNLILNDCDVASPLYSTTANKGFNQIYLANCTGTLGGGTPGEAVNWVVRGGSFQIGNINMGTFSANGGTTSFWGVGVSLGTNVTLTGGFDGSGTGFTGTLHDWRNNLFGPAFGSVTLAFTTSNIRFSGNVNGGSENGGFFNSQITFTDCGRGRNISQIPSYDYGTCSITDNHMTGVKFTITQRRDSSQINSATLFTGTYGSVVIDGQQINANIAINTEFDSPPVLDISGNKNIVVATINKSSQAGNGTPVRVTGNNNYVTFSQQGYSGSYTDLGSGNIINAASTAPLTMAIADAKGDLLAAIDNDDIRRLAVGTNDQVLTADSTATLGVAWKAPFQSNFLAKADILVGTGPSAFVRLTAGQDFRTLRLDSSTASGVSWDYQRTLINRLTTNQASLETDTTGWAAESGCTIARSTAKFSHGAASLEITKS